MPSTKNYHQLHKQVITRPGAVERLAELRKETLAEIELQEIRGVLKLSQTDLAEAMGITQSAVSQFEHGDDILISTLDNYVQGLGATLRIAAVFEGDEVETVIPIQIGSKTR
ncbi:helix-turn-helix domain-containing protein [Candidatus Poriferisocius sp.]|uniref:helix-turn-helix domain-containing protein n=1 Tax=Candidatus Poriferisocius sp. TaxID=3101276 RepID=UPI003B5156B7